MSSRKRTLACLAFFALFLLFVGAFSAELPVSSGSNQRLFQLSVSAITKEVPPGETFRFYTKMSFNTGTKISTPYVLNYQIRHSQDKSNILLNVSKEGVLLYQETFNDAFHIPKNATTGNYVIEASLFSSEYNSTISSADYFSVDRPFFIFSILYALLDNPLAYVIYLVLAPLAFLGYKGYGKLKDYLKKKQKYVATDVSKLPKPGARSIWLGKVAETPSNAYYDIDKIQTHMVAAGGTGSGKSVSMQVIVEELLLKNIPVIVVDPTAQWTGFIRPQKDPAMLRLFPNFGIKPEDARAFPTNLLDITDPTTEIDVRDYMKPGEITVLNVNKIPPGQLDGFVKKMIEKIFASPWGESHELKLLIIFDEVHRLLPKFGGKGGYIAIERGCREFRKWGIGLVMISQVLLDFKGAIRTNIGTEIQLRTKYEGDINRVKTKYGPAFAATITKLIIGTGIMQNPEYNDGKPWYVQFRPLLHSTFRISEEDLAQYKTVTATLKELKSKLEEMKKKGRDVYDLGMEINLAEEKLKQGNVSMASTYLEGVKQKLSIGKN